LAPQNVTRERVVERNAIQEHEGATRAAWPEVAQSHALSRRIRGPAAVAPKETEPRDLGPENIIEPQLRSAPEFLFVDNVNAERRSRFGIGKAVSLDHNRFDRSFLSKGRIENARRKTRSQNQRQPSG
jgi:hypothetical protein